MTNYLLMHYVPAILFVLACACFGFAYWGLETPSGRTAYDEMAGIIPMAIGLLGGILLLIAIALWGWRWYRTRNEKQVS